MPIQKDQIEMMKRIQNEMTNSLKEKVKELEATKIMIEEENEKLQERILQLVAAERAHRANFQVVQVTNKNLLRLIKRQITEMEEELECLICFEVSDTAPIFKCPEDHLICGKCRPFLSVCPLCRSKLAATYQRFRGAEKMVDRLQAMEGATIFLQQKKKLSRLLTSLNATLDLGYEYFTTSAKAYLGSQLLRMNRQAISLQEGAHLQVEDVPSSFTLLLFTVCVLLVEGVSSFLPPLKTNLIRWMAWLNEEEEEVEEEGEEEAAGSEAFSMICIYFFAHLLVLILCFVFI